MMEYSNLRMMSSGNPLIDHEVREILTDSGRTAASLRAIENVRMLGDDPGAIRELRHQAQLSRARKKPETELQRARLALKAKMI